MKKSVICAGMMILGFMVMTGCGADDNAPDATDLSSQTGIDEQEGIADTADENGGAMSKMIVKSSGVTNGVIDPKYGSNGDIKENDIPTLSIPLEIENAPEQTVCFALYMDDPDAKPLAGYNWVHWTAVNIPGPVIAENYSREPDTGVVQGTTDYGTIGYGGPAPPDKDHTYVIVVYALDAKVTLDEGFDKEKFQEAIDGHVLASATLKAVYKK